MYFRTLLSILKIWKIVLKIWRTRNLTVQSKTIVFKTLGISKVIHLPLVTNVPHWIIDWINKTKKEFIWNQKQPKIRHSTICNFYKNSVLTTVDIPDKSASSQCSWVKRLYSSTTHCWKVIPAFLIKEMITFGWWFVVFDQYLIELML